MRAYIVLFAIYLLTSTGINATLEDCIYYTDCSNTLDCNEPSSCISDYDSLETYVRNNKSIINDLAQAFYRTGHSPARFVRITYNFQIPSYFNNSRENDSYTDSIENDTCSSDQKIYYWSTSPVYLLGPKPLMYLSLFAVIVQEENVIIQLPCFETPNDQKALLSRLTYLVCYSYEYLCPYSG